MSLARNTLRRTLSLLTILGLLIGVAAMAHAAQCPQEALASFGPVNQFAFPAYYVDQGGEALEMCYDINDPLCGAIGPVPDPNAPLDVASGNFLPEAPYSFVTADLTLPTGGRALLVLSVMGTWGNATGEVIDGTQTAFSRVRFRVDTPQAGLYTLTYPFGVMTLNAAAAGRRSINFTEDCLLRVPATCGEGIGNFFTTPLDPTQSHIGHFLAWDPAQSAPPPGYVGNPNIPHTVIGSPCGTNFFRVEGPGLPSGGVQTNLFSVQGKKAAICGNGFLDAGEQCDDGNMLNGDCCSASCQFEPAETSCDDGNVCTDNSTCDGAGICQVMGFNTSGCDDGSACTTSDQCSSGTCSGGPAPNCDDRNPCTDDSCDPAIGCVHTNNTGSCNDGNACTTNDRCSAGSCVGGAAPNCDDGNSCTTDSCSSGPGCQHHVLSDGVACTDGDACTQSDTCLGGACVGTDPVVCTALDQCHDAGTCNPASGTCSNPNKTDGAACADSDACTQTDTCQAGVCTGANPVVCTALDQCHDAGVCDPASGTCSNPNKADGAACADGDACTQTDTCQAGVCTGANPVVCTALDQCHAAGVCDPASGTCSNPNKAEGSTCSDGDACTQTDTCEAGACVGANPVVCTALDQCHDAGTCDPASGTCSNPDKADGSACADGDACTQTDTCQAGVCTGANPVVCAALDQCHVAGVCDPASGTCSNPDKPNGSACTDSNACTQTDTCQAGSCTGTNSVVCTALDQCHVAGVCNPANGTCSNPNQADGATCNDGLFCTVNDTCTSGVCGGAARDCSAAGNACNTGVCHEASDSCDPAPRPNGTVCDDGDACTQTDTCRAGVCRGRNPVVCAALDQCHVAGTCDPASGTCSNPNKADGSACADGDACTQTDTCQAGSCIGANPVVCAALDQCHVAGVCDPASGTCSNPNKADGSACADGDACTQSDTCQAGVCTGANPIVCTALDQCHVAGVCDPASGACSNPNKADGSACADGDACTQTDACQAGSCIGANPVVCTALDQCHATGVCDPTNGICSNPDKADGSACSDGDACTQSDTCEAGSCIGTNPVVCAALDQCHVAGVCDPASGTCSNPNTADGSACNDGDACTLSDTCQAGICTGANPVVCEALDQCHDAGTCDPETGTCSNPNTANGAVCTDGDACTQTDTCQAGSCIGTNPVVCTALDQCHVAGVCDPTTGICSNPNEADGTSCDDGQFCTVNDTCAAGVCGGASRDCSAVADQCNDGTCNEAAGRCEPTPKAEGTACSDGNLCTSNDTCQAGVCGGAPLVCDDADPCTIDTCDPTAGCMVQPVTGLAAATCLLTPQAVCQPMPPAIAKAIARAQSRMASAGATSNHGRAKRLLGQASHTLKMAAKKALKFAKKRHLSPACAGALSRNLLEASSRLVQLRKTL